MLAALMAICLLDCDLPPLSAASGLPSYEVAAAFNLSAADNWRKLCKWRGEGCWAATVAYKSWCVWDAVENAVNPAFTELVRRKSLKELLRLVGWRALLTAELPWPIPPDE